MKSSFVSPSEVAGNTSTLFYLLCIVEAGSPAHQLVRDGAISGIEANEPLFPIEAGNLVAVACRVPRSVFGEAELNELMSHLTTLAPYAMRHEGAIRDLSEQSPALLPMAFGSVFEDIRHISARVTDNAASFQRQLDRIRGKEEWSILIFRDIRQAFDYAEKRSERLREIDAQIADARPGKAYVLGKQRERLVQTEADRMAEQGLQNCMDRLAATSVAVQLDDVPAVAEPGSPVPVLKAAFLIERTAVDGFAGEAESLRSTYGPMGFTIEVKGPWAPYSFVGEERVHA